MSKKNHQEKKNFLFIQNVWTQAAIIILVLLFISHVIAFFLLSRYNEQTELNVNRGIAKRQIITIAQAVEINPPAYRSKTVNAIVIPNFTVSLDSRPKYSVRVPQLDPWAIAATLNQLSPKTRDIDVSIKVDDHSWLNISALVLHSSLTYQVVLFAFELVIIAALIFIIWSLNRFNRPLKRFIGSVEKMGRTLQVNMLSETDGPQIVREAAKAINNMQQRLNNLIRERGQMMAAISHDLRTPITRLKLRAHFIPDEEQQQKIIDDLDEMESMINESLAFFKDDQLPLPKTQVDLASLLASLCIDYQETNRQVSYEGPTKNVPIYANSLGLKRAFSNIIDNAIKYGSLAKVKLEETPQNYKITIEDNGPGIPEAEIEKAFLPFYRGEQSRSRSTGGTGLGLAVARNMVVAHDGEVTLHSPECLGLQVVITLPRKS